MSLTCGEWYEKMIALRSKEWEQLIESGSIKAAMVKMNDVVAYKQMLERVSQ
ncbi:hypothetical protein [Enterovibrio calviensis]|uniref:hypothetical protein n=1 Tax=Enterovibrio calviensis TaxID=91359 RepID=UPI000B13284A|nr:hypothetical protein [Enterovibrio calviensis]